MDITNTHLEAAIIDQTAAGAFSGKLYCFVPVYQDGSWQLGVAIANERGYHPIAGKTFDKEDEVATWAASLNEHIGLSSERVCSIICSTMGGRSIYISSEYRA